jgi:hypothetical protein
VVSIVRTSFSTFLISPTIFSPVIIVTTSVAAEAVAAVARISSTQRDVRYRILDSMIRVQLGSIFLMLLPWMPSPPINPFWLKMKA